MKQIFSLCSLLLFSGLIYSQQLPQAAQQKTEEALLEKMADGQEELSFLVWMNKQADLSEAGKLKYKNQKAAYVFNRLKQTADDSQKEIIAFLQQQEQPVAWTSLYIVNAIHVKGSAALARELAGRTDVARLIANSAFRYSEPVERQEDAPTSRSLIEWGLERINADKVWELGYRGQGVVVGGQDTGYDWQHPALKASYRGFDAANNTADHNYNWHDAIHEYNPLNSDTLNPCGLDSPVPCDDNSHGTHTMGTMTGLEGGNVIGVAPEARWCACRNMERGWGSPFTYLECFQWFLAPTDLNGQNPDPARAPHVINNSWYCPELEGCDPSNFDVMNVAVNNLRAAGTVVVVSAGNSGNECSSVSAPAAMYEGSFSVGATAQNDTIAGFSSRGPVVVDGSGRLKPNVSAPGVGVRSSVPNGGYASFSGTSMAGPHVAGLVALVISANPELAGQVELIENIIEQTAVPKTTDQNCGNIPGTEVPNHTYGFGRVDALAAVEEALSLISNASAEEARADWQIFPNPTADRLTLVFQNISGTVQFTMFDLSGRIVQEYQWQISQSDSQQLDLSAQPAGIYFYRLLAGEKLSAGKIIKQ